MKTTLYALLLFFCALTACKETDSKAASMIDEEKEKTPDEMIENLTK